jgi:predicted HTH transcriptional regulator
MSAKESTSLDNLRAGQKIAWDMFSGKNKPNQVNTPKAPSRNPEIRDKIIEVLRKRSLTAAELARMFQTTRPNMHKILRRMEDKGMLRAMRNDVILVNGTKTYRWTTESRKT